MEKSKAKERQKHDDTYGILNKPIEVDTDVNEDPVREKLLDDSLESFLENESEAR